MDAKAKLQSSPSLRTHNSARGDCAFLQLDGINPSRYTSPCNPAIVAALDSPFTRCRMGATVVDTTKVAGRRQLHFVSIDDISADVEKLAAGEVRTLGNWSGGQI